MKLTKFIKMIDTMNDCYLFDVDKDETVWSGDTYLLDLAINGTEKEIQQFYKESKEDEDWAKDIPIVESAKIFKNYKLVRNEDGEAALFYPYINDRGVPLLKIQINVRKGDKK